jgi:uncharacterized protein YkwD
MTLSPAPAEAAAQCGSVDRISARADEGDSKEDYLTAINAARAEVGVPPVTWDDTVAEYAQNYANQRIGDCNVVYSGGQYGENIAWARAIFRAPTRSRCG